MSDTLLNMSDQIQKIVDIGKNNKLKWIRVKDIEVAFFDHQPEVQPTIDVPPSEEDLPIPKTEEDFLFWSVEDPGHYQIKDEKTPN